MKKTIPFFISGIILFIIFSKINIPDTQSIIKKCDLTYIIVAIILTLPIYIVSSVRLKLLIPHKNTITIKQSGKLIALGNLLNIILPAKMGDLSKALFLKKHHNQKGTTALTIVLFEKVCDMISLFVICLAGLITSNLVSAYPKTFIILTCLLLLGTSITLSRKISHFIFRISKIITPKALILRIKPLFLTWTRMQHTMSKNTKLYAFIWLLSLLFSLTHLIQLWLLFASISQSFPFTTHLALTPLAVLAGLIPLTLSGIGTRDGALVVLFAKTVSYEAATLFGLLSTLRLLILGLPGIFFVKMGLFKKYQ